MKTLIIDIRTTSEFNQRHVPGAVNLPFSQITDHIAALNSYGKDTPIIVYGRDTQRSSHVKDVLASLGFHNILNNLAAV